MEYNYKRMAQYYETDQMGVIHHSNYIRWFEEARVDLMDKMGFSYEECEKQGILIPVLEVHCKYHTPVKFGQTVVIKPRVKKISFAKLIIGYEVVDANTNELRVSGETVHCFVNEKFKPIALMRECKQLYDIFKSIEHEEK